MTSLRREKSTSSFIPEYQRPYEWDQEQVDTLFNDLWEFSANDKDESEDYFLGCIVFFENEGEYENHRRAAEADVSLPVPKGNLCGPGGWRGIQAVQEFHGQDREVHLPEDDLPARYSKTGLCLNRESWTHSSEMS